MKTKIFVTASLAIIIISLAQMLFASCVQGHSGVYKDTIQGKIDAVTIEEPYAVITVKAVKYKFIAVGYSDEFKFNKIAKPGDWVNKKANSDSLHLIHEEDEGFYFVLK